MRSLLVLLISALGVGMAGAANALLSEEPMRVLRFELEPSPMQEDDGGPNHYYRVMIYCDGSPGGNECPGFGVSDRNANCGDPVLVDALFICHYDDDTGFGAGVAVWTTGGPCAETYCYGVSLESTNSPQQDCTRVHVELPREWIFSGDDVFTPWACINY